MRSKEMAELLVRITTDLRLISSGTSKNVLLTAAVKMVARQTS